MKTIRLISVLAAAAGLIISYSSCERHSYEETSKLQHHGDHGESHDGDAGHGETDHGDGDHAGDKDHKKDDHGSKDAKDAKGEEKGRKVF